MGRDAEQQRRRSIRLPEYDYTQAGAYFITVVAHGRATVFGKIADGETRLNEFGRIVEDEWQKSATVRHEIQIDTFVVMPNHIHGIVNIVVSAVGATGRSPFQMDRDRDPGRLRRRVQIRGDQTN